MLDQDTNQGAPDVGDVIDAKYALFDHLEVESDANVFRARHIASREFVHLYLFEPNDGPEPEGATPHVDEFKLQALTSFMHPNVVRVREVARAADNRRYIAYNEVEGPTLRQYLSTHGPMAQDDALRVMHGVLDALGAGHARGLVHGRLSPDTIVMSGSDESPTGFVREFGVLTVLDLDDLPELSVSATYMAPEQLRGSHPSIQSDLYTWGLILAETLMGHPVFAASDAGNISAQQLSSDPVPLPEGLEDQLGKLLERAVRKSPEDRYRSADELFYAVAQMQHGHFGGDAAALVGTGSHPAFSEFGTYPEIEAPADKPPEKTGEQPAVGNDSQPGIAPAAAAAAVPSQPVPHPASMSFEPPPAGNPLLWVIPAVVASLAVLGGIFYLITSQSEEPPPPADKPAETTETSPAETRMPPAPLFLGWSHDAGQASIPLLTASTQSGITLTATVEVTADSNSPSKTACETGDPVGCLAWARWTAVSNDPDADWQTAVTTAQNACTADATDGCAIMGLAYRHGRIVEQSRSEARRHYERACRAEDGLGCFGVGTLFEDGFGVDASNAAAVDWYRQGCEHGFVPSCIRFGRMLDGAKNVHADFELAVNLYRQACDAGFGEGCDRLARMYEKARGVESDADGAFKLREQACDFGYGPSCRELGYGLRNFKGPTEDDLVRAAGFYARGCELEDGKSCDGACYLTLHGEGVEKDAAGARTFCEKSCAIGDADGCYRFAVMLRDGVGGDKDQARASEMMKRSCDAGHDKACR